MLFRSESQMRRVRIECHKWLSDKLVRTWGQEVIFIVYRKIGDCTIKADKLTQEGVSFLVADEQPEATYRRILGELKEAEDNVPPLLIDQTLAEFGYIRKSTADELKAAEDRLAQLRQDEESAAAAAAAEEAASEIPPISPVAQAMAKRTPLNQSVEAPPPERVVVTPPPEARQVSPAQSQGTVSARASALAALEADADLVGALDASMPAAAHPRPEPQVMELGGSQARLDPSGAASIIDQPPPAGINPKFRPPSR